MDRMDLSQAALDPVEPGRGEREETPPATGWDHETGPGRWVVDPAETEIRFSVGLVGFLTVEGRFANAEGTVVLDDGAPHRSHVDLSIEAASIDTRNPIRDLHLRSRSYLDVRRYPRIGFESARVVSPGEKSYRVTGDLTLRGVTREVTLDVVHEEDTVEAEVQRRRFSVEMTLDRKDFGVDPGVAGLGFLIGDDVTVRGLARAAERHGSGEVS